MTKSIEFYSRNYVITAKGSLAGSKEPLQLIYPMKKALALILACCVLVAQDKPAAEAPKAAAADKSAEAKPKIPPINVRDELIELIHQLKRDAGATVNPPTVIQIEPSLQASLSARYDAQMRAKAEAQRLLLQALVELAKESEGKAPTKVYHSSNPLPVRKDR